LDGTTSKPCDACGAQSWMDPEVMEALAERDAVLRKYGFPHDPQWGEHGVGEYKPMSREKAETYGIPDVGPVSSPPPPLARTRCVVVPYRVPLCVIVSCHFYV
jgi:hypothetical protein